MGKHVEDPYYGLDKRPSHHGVAVPRFDVREDEDAFYLDGEVPGVTSAGAILTEAIDGTTLIIRGKIEPKAGAEHAKIPEQHGNSSFPRCEHGQLLIKFQPTKKPPEQREHFLKKVRRE
jgi:HSP20 family molecular chaperone IbpA